MSDHTQSPLQEQRVPAPEAKRVGPFAPRPRFINSDARPCTKTADALISPQTISGRTRTRKQGVALTPWRSDLLPGLLQPTPLGEHPRNVSSDADNARPHLGAAERPSAWRRKSMSSEGSPPRYATRARGLAYYCPEA